ncbi:MAG: aspartyl/asparaginyl beta-hydroxylase domain-containing protein [Sphingomonadaceae bacterium]|nr:aspartyl/asparaginyl beta-hydroxylase domain-containing protein [Sphingomonadaceae bacterium]
MAEQWREEGWAREAKRPYIITVGKKLRPKIDAIAAASSLIPDAPLLDQNALPWTAGLAAEWQAIRDEMETIRAHDAAIPPLVEISPDHSGIAKGGDWKSFFLYGYGERIAANCARAPHTCALIERVPNLNTAFFSILAPGAHIPRHRGVTKGLVTWHLGLKVPREAERCRMQVDSEIVHWGEGQSFLFDDTYEHEVWNDTDETRVILLIQVRRPMAWPGSIAPDLFLWGVRRSPFVKDAVKNIEQWEAAYKAVEADD